MISRRAIIAISAVAAVVLGGFLALLLPGGEDKAAAGDVMREPVMTTGARPFMSNVGTDDTNVTPPRNTGGSFAGSTPGLYGGTRSIARCDAQKMVVLLRADPDKAAAWAGVLGIRPVDIPSYLGGLTPVILRYDTYVTNHGFVEGHATTIPAVLQAGTAVRQVRHAGHEVLLRQSADQACPVLAADLHGPVVADLLPHGDHGRTAGGRRHRLVHAHQPLDGPRLQAPPRHDRRA